MKYIILFLSAALIFASCNPAKKAQRTPPATTADSSVKTETASTDDMGKASDSMAMETISTVLEKLNHLEYTTFSGKAGVIYKAKGDTKNFDVKVQIHKDSLIWASVIGPLGIEVARGIITPDSVRIINKLNKQYISSSYVYLQEQLGLPLDLATLQDLLVGNPVFIDKTNSSYTKQDDTLQITSRTKFFRNLLSAMLPDYLPAVSNLDDVDADRNRSATLTYGGYEKVNGARFPRSRTINVKYKTEIQIQLDYKSFTFNEALHTPFSVPKGYKTKK
ncbi:lipoprotein insertase outer membrane protein LolB [Niabella aurantiaca]|uniref:lipoprotein insertase outer membrane protein LolB n=1 Tax=Niabella aurantiaca TaxID=379900 RepID=UPI00036E073C|nr:lipoprotein insertase outer membrane protein LolB [Niabella aurantiaca]